MNLFTRFLSRNNRNAQLEQLIDHWDTLEALIISVFKAKVASADDRTTYTELRAWLLANYPEWESQLESYWRATEVGGELAPEDPFRRLFVHDEAGGFVGDWVAMQNLAAAREALNRFVLAQNV